MALTSKQRRFAISTLEKSIDHYIKQYLSHPGYAADGLIANKITILNYLKAQEAVHIGGLD